MFTRCPKSHSRFGRWQESIQRSIYLLNKSYAITKTTHEAEQLRDDIVFFRDVHGRLNTRSPAARDPGEIDSAIRQLVSDAIQYW